MTARRAAGFLVLLAWAVAVSAAPTDGRWQLAIRGHHTFVFGDQRLSAGLRISWETIIEFRIQDGDFQLGYGVSRWLPGVSSHSVPPGWFLCRLSDGTFLDRTLQLQHTPWVRYPKFPVAGALRDATVVLRPDLQPPGNYLALTYHCESDRPGAEEWFALAARARQEEGRRQDAVTAQQGSHRSAEIKEVRVLPPEGALTLPLQDGWFLQIGDPDTPDRVDYRLQRLPD